MPPFWCAARLMPKREAVATQCLTLAGFEIYLPRLREHRVVRNRRVEVSPPLFPGYLFVAIVLQWHGARWCPGILNLLMDGDRPARVPDAVITELRGRERNGLVELARPPRFRRDASESCGAPSASTWRSMRARLRTSASPCCCSS
jgi:transcription antitermination factor NusG